MARKDLVKCLALTFKKLEKVVGLGKRQNDILFSVFDGLSSPKRRHVIFFPGDVQNFHQNMLNHPSNSNWSRWSYENASVSLHSRFKDSYVWLVVPSRIHDETFSCYDNFLPCGTYGSPTGVPVDFGGLAHLRELLFSSIDRVNQLGDVEVPAVSVSVPAVVVAFSKGCTVLNQVVRELAATRVDEEIVRFLRAVEAFYWVDSGHNGKSDVWITDKRLLQDLADAKVKVRVHVSPRQVHDPKRPHIGKEERIFVDTLRRKGADVSETLHFEDEELSLEQHFRVLEKI